MPSNFVLAILGGAALAIAAPTPLKVDITLPTNITTVGLVIQTNHFGTGTVYDQFGGYGSCGAKHSDDELIVALTYAWQGHHWPPAYCGRKVVITNTGSNDRVGGKGKTVTATVADTCPGCRSADSMDLSHGVWNALTNHAAPGTINIQWYMI